MQMILAIGFGGALGAIARHYFAGVITKAVGTSFPYGTMAVNILGSLIMGVLVAAFAARLNGMPELRGFLTVGILGSFTTFSTYSLETVLLIERGDWQAAIMYAFGSLFVGVLALMFGLWLGRLFV
ncbi:fluoride efflux transporter CrcB [Kordiimonas aquimaris]|uniref:fluoride efflux transporter CrcB n=1 Tax=Kordiimonas aquimaris TaxID=707591 RepID=UPI0021D27199|nr:fluoride efflux transporter CrcB [Kordiimonas aquimaris]